MHLKEVEKQICKSDIGFTPQTGGNCISHSVGHSPFWEEKSNNKHVVAMLPNKSRVDMHPKIPF